MQGGGHVLGRNGAAHLEALAHEQQGHRADVPAAGEHQAQAAGVVGIDAIQRPARLVAAVVEIRRAIGVVRRPRIERVRDHEVDARHLHVVGPPLHFRIGEVLPARAEDFDHRHVVRLAVDVGDGTAELGRLPGRADRTASRLPDGELREDGVDRAHVAVALQPHHVAGAELAVDDRGRRVP